MTSSRHQLDLARGDVEVQIAATRVLLDIAAMYVALGHDDRLDTAMKDARERMRAALAVTKRVVELRRTADLDGEAANEYRAQRGAA